jgi:hypothetical protein
VVVIVLVIFFSCNSLACMRRIRNFFTNVIVFFNLGRRLKSYII